MDMKNIMQKSDLHDFSLINKYNKNQNIISDSFLLLHFERLRLNKLFSDAIKYPLVIVCAGTGYGKTYAVHDFVNQYQSEWIQIMEEDNNTDIFLKKFIYSIQKLDSKNTLKRRIIVIDDFQIIENPSLIHYFEESILQKIPSGTSIVLISRVAPNFNTSSSILRGTFFNINEKELIFTETELVHYFNQLDICLQPESQREIMLDTGGWALAINLIIQSYKRSPGYIGYIRSAMKMNVFKIIKEDIWDIISNRLKILLIQLSMIKHHSFDIVSIYAEEDETLILELEQQNAYIRRDNNINAYLMHPLFLEFLFKNLSTQYTVALDTKIVE